MAEVKSSLKRLKPSVRTHRVTSGDPLIGKRVNQHGELGVVIGIDYYTSSPIGVVVIRSERYDVNTVVMRHVVEAWPEVISRASFNYKPGDRG